MACKVMIFKGHIGEMSEVKKGDIFMLLSAEGDDKRSNMNPHAGKLCIANTDATLITDGDKGSDGSATHEVYGDRLVRK